MNLSDAVQRSLMSGLQLTEVEAPSNHRRRFHFGHSEDQGGEIILVQIRTTWCDSFAVYIVKGNRWFVAEVPIDSQPIGIER